MAGAGAGAAEARALYRAFLKEGAKYPNYNIREYVWRKARGEFRDVPEALQGLGVAERLAAARQQLEVVRRQAIVYSLYGRKFRSIMDIPMEEVLEEQATIGVETLPDKGPG